jgi:protein-disulfide isomerase
VLDDYREGSSRGVQGTPTLFINNQKVAGFRSFEDLEAIIKQELA